MRESTPDKESKIVPSQSAPNVNQTTKHWPRDFAKLTILSQNINGMKDTQSEKIDILLKHIIEHSIQIMCLQETWREKKYLIKIASINNLSCMLFYYRPDKQEGHRSGRVGFLLNPKGIKG